jgi:hydroxyacylglutathione hydrolase
MNVLPGVDLVGGGRLGFSLSDKHDSNVFLVHSDGDAVLIDAGCGLASERIVSNISAAGVEPGAISRIQLTHAHADHAAGAASLATLVGAQVAASSAVARIVEAGDEEASGLATARQAGVYPPQLRFVATPIRPMDDLHFNVGHIEVTAVPTPGHARGHLCYLAVVDGRRVLFSGDLVFTRGRIALLATPDTDPLQLAASIGRVAALEPDILLPGHGSFALTDAAAHLNEALAAFHLHRLPAGLV